MSRRTWVLLLLCLVLAQASAAQEASFTIVSFKVKDIKTNDALVSLPASIEALNLNTGYSEKNSDYIDADGLLIYKLTPGNWQVRIGVDNTSTEQVDYFAEQFIYIQAGEPLLNKSFYARPVGVMAGTVVDAEGKPAADADLDFKCKTDVNFKYPAETDKFGAFKTVLPVGRCTVSAAYQGEVGSVAVDVRQGALVQQTIQVGKKRSWLLFVIIPLLAGIVGYLIYHFLKRRVAKEVVKEIKKEIKEKRAAKAAKKEAAEATGEKAPEAEKKEELNPRARDIMATLNDRERAIVQDLLESGHAGTQATIRNHTGIPKTSLVRSFQSLEDKKVMTVEKVGKMKKVRLTDWFLGKE